MKTIMVFTVFLLGVMQCVAQYRPNAFDTNTTQDAQAATVSSRILKTYNVEDFGAIPQGKIANDCYMTAGSTTLTIHNSYGDKSAFVAGDVGSSIMVYYAGVAKSVSYGAVPTTNYLALVSTIVAVNNSTNITLADPALHTVGATLPNINGADQWNCQYTGMPAIYGKPTSVAALNAAYAYVATNFLTTTSGGGVLFHPEGIYILTNAPVQVRNCKSILSFPYVEPLGGELAPVIKLTGPVGAATQLPSKAGFLSFRGATMVSFYNPPSSLNNPSFSAGFFTNVESVLSCQPPNGGFFGMGQNGLISANGFRLDMDNMTWILPPDHQYSGLDLRGAENVEMGNLYVGSGISYNDFQMTNELLTWPTATNTWGLMLAPGNNAGDSDQDGLLSIFGFYNGLYPSEHFSVKNILIATCYNGVTPDAIGHPPFWGTLECDETINAIYSLRNVMNSSLNIGSLQMENLESTNNPNAASGFIPVAVNETNAGIHGIINIFHDSPITNNLNLIAKSIINDVDTSNPTNVVPAMSTIPIFTQGVAIGPHRSGYAAPSQVGINDGMDAWGLFPQNSSHFLTMNHYLNGTLSSPFFIEDRFLDINYALVGGNPFGHGPVPMPSGATIGGTVVFTNGFSSLMAGIPGAVTVGASPFTFTNPNLVAIECYFSGATAYRVAKNSVVVYGSLAGDSYFVLQPAATCTITYTVAPTFYTNSW